MYKSSYSRLIVLEYFRDHSKQFQLEIAYFRGLVDAMNAFDGDRRTAQISKAREFPSISIECL